MIANFFNKTKPINTLFIITLLLIVYVFSLSLNESFEVSIYNISKRFIYFLLLLLILFTFNFINRKNNLTRDNSYAILLFVLLLGMFPFSVLNFDLAIANFILLLAYRRIYSLRTSKDTKEKLFDSALWIGIATLIYSWSALVLLLIYAAIFLFDKSTWRNVIIPIFGFITPIIIYGTYLLAINNFNLFYDILNFQNNFSFSAYNSLQLLLPLSIVCGLILWAIFPTTFKITAINNEFKNSWFLLILHFFTLVLVILPWPSKNGSEFLFLFFPITIIFTNYLQLVKESWFKEVFLYSFLVLLVAVYFL